MEMKFVNLRCILLFVIVISVTNCISEKRKIKMKLKKWYNKEILFSDDIKISSLDSVSIDDNFFTAKYKILTYIDTAGCTECKLKLYEWKLFKEEIAALDLDVSFLFIAWQKDYNILEELRYKNDFLYPFLYDAKGSMELLNKFSDIREYGTFLLDSCNRIKLIGSPIANDKLRGLYLEWMAEL